MSIDIKLLTEERNGGDFFRLVDFRVGSGPYSRLLPSWRNGLKLPPKMETWWKPISEISLRITLSQLRELDTDAAAQAKFIRRYLDPEPGTVGLPTINLLLEPDDRIMDSDVEYLAVLSSPSGCVSAIAPLLYNFHYTATGIARPHSPVDVDKYLGFVERFIKASSPTNNQQIQMMMPSNMPFSKVGKLLELFKDVDTPFLMVDAFGTTVRERFTQVRKAIGIGEKGTYSLREKRGERFALYAFDTKSSTGRGPKVAAQRLVHLDGGYSSFGPLRTNRTMVTRPPKGLPPPPKVFVSSEIAYFRAGIPGSMSDLREWCQEQNPPFASAPTSRVAEHSLHSQIRVAKQMGDWSLSGTLGKELDKRQVIRPELSAVRRNNGKILSKQVQKTLVP